MSLKVWLPLDGDLRNLGCSDYNFTTVETPTYTTGKIGQCYQRMNSNTQSTNGINIDNNLVNVLGTQASIAVWIKPLGTHTHYNGTIISSGNWNTKQWAFGVSQDNSQVDVLCGGYNSYITCAVPVNEWTHLVSTFNNGVCKLYKNGVYIGEKTGQAAFVSDASNACIGRETYAGGYFGFNGCINDVRIYDHCLSAAEVHEIAMGLVLHYKLDKNKSQLANVYNYPTFDTSNSGGGWNHWGQSGASGAYGQNTDKKYIWNKNNTYSHWVSNSSSATGHYLLYQSPAFDGGYRSVQCIVKEENGLPITTSIVYATWNAQSGGLTNDTFSSIIHLGDGFYLCKAEGMKQDGSNDLVGFYVKPGYKVYFSEAYLENSKEMCSDIFEQDNLTTIEDSSGYGHNGTINGALTISSDTPRYNTSSYFGEYNTPNVTLNNPTSLLPSLTNCTITWWGKYDTARTLLLTGQTTSQYLAASDNNTYYHSVSGVTFYKDGVVGSYKCAADGWHFFTMKNVNISSWTALKLNSYSSYWYLKGLISDFRIYCTPLLDNDIKMLYNVGMKVDNLQNLHTFEYKENTSNLFRSELIMPWAKANRTRIGEIVSHNNTYALNIAPEPFYKNISDSIGGALDGMFIQNTSYIFDMWIDTDSVIYNNNNVAGGMIIRYSDNSTDNTFVFTGGNKGYQHKVLITPSNKTIQRLEFYYYTSTDVFYRIDSCICPLSNLKLHKTGIFEGTNLLEEINTKLIKNALIETNEIIEM